MFTWYLSNQQIPIISYLFQQLIYSWFFSSKSDSDLGTLFPDRTLINWRNVTGDPHSSFRANGDFLHVIFLSQCYHSCMTVLGFAEKSSAPEHYPLPEDMEKLRKAQKLEYLYGISEKEVDSFIFQSEEQIQKLKTEEEIDILQQQELTAKGRFPCRFPGCNKSFKYNGKTRRNHELFHHPRVQFKDSTIMTQSSPECTALQKETKAGDDVYNYNCAILADSFLFFNFLNAIKEGVGERIVQQYKYIMLSCKANGSHSTKYALECLTRFFFVFALLSQRDSKQFVWNRSVNNSGKKSC